MSFPCLALALALALCAPAGAATITLHDEDFGAPNSHNNDGEDVDQRTTVNGAYGGQPAGFAFAQTFTVETLNVSGSRRGTGTAAHGTGWQDPRGRGGDFAIGMLSTRQNDLLGLSFDVGALAFLNVFVDVSSVDLLTYGGPFVPAGAVPRFRFSSFDDPSGARTTGGGTLLSSAELTGTASPGNAFDWTRGAFGLSTAGNTNGNVTLQIDLLEGGYAAFDNLRIEASVAPPPPIPLPAGAALPLGGIAPLGGLRAIRGGARRA